MALADVTCLVPPPARTGGIGTLVQWHAVETELGFTFPSDYRDFIFTYGNGAFAGEISVYNPFWGADYLPHVYQLCQMERDFRVRFPNRVPYPVWPEPGGVFPWGDDQNGNYYLWLTEGNPDEWQVVTNEIRGHGYRAHHCTMTEYLAGIMRGHILPMMSDFPTPDAFVFRATLPPE